MAIMRQMHRGFGLVELMIAITLGILLSTAVIQVFLATNSSSKIQDSMAVIQENARFAMRLLAQEIRMAGYMGCSSVGAVTLNNIAVPAAEVDFSAATALRGQDNVVAGNALTAVVGSDTISLKRGSKKYLTITGNLSPNNANIQVEDNTAGFVKDDFVMVTDCSSGDVFRITNTPKMAGQGQTTVTHSNASNSDNRLSKIYSGEAEIFGFETIDFYIGDTGRKSSAGNPINALFSRQRTLGSGGVTGAPVELVEGVEDMQLSYGVDTGSDRAVDVYRAAVDVVDWSKVLSVRIELLLYGLDDNVVGKTGSANAQSLTDGRGDLIVNSDGRMRQVFTNVFAIRNRMQ